MATVFVKKHKGKTKTTYQVYYKDPLTGEKKYYRTYPRHREAQCEANDLRSLLNSGKSPKDRRRKILLMTFGTVGESLQADWDAALARRALTRKTHEDYSYWLNSLIREFGGRFLCQMTREEVVGFVNRQATLNSCVSSNKYLSIFQRVFRKGIELNALTTNPVAGIKKMDEQHRNRFILPHDLDRLIAATQTNRGKFYMPAVIYLGAEHGASKQEILSLNWADINFDFGGKGFIRFYRTKNKRERSDFLMPRSKEALLSWQDHLERKRKKDKVAEIKSDRVFTRVDGTPLKSFNKAWWACLKVARIRDFHFHDLRHTFCSNLILSGSDLKIVKEMIGHRDISMTDRYSHLTFGHKLQHQKLLADYYINGCQGK